MRAGRFSRPVASAAVAAYRPVRASGAQAGAAAFFGAYTMTSDPDPVLFVDALSHEIRPRGVPVLQSELRAWVASAWPLIVEDPSPARWAAAWLEQRRTVGA